MQIIGRATRDADGKERARFTNLIAEPTAEQSAAAEVVNDMFKAISARLLVIAAFMQDKREAFLRSVRRFVVIATTLYLVLLFVGASA